ncbi:MAG TPA: CGNR zinc finger domain-containing protein [Actinomycetota bacterium]|nr:CGNR zinc finger domain-containing protein [Actinomycetota bacterium]
MKRRKEIPEGIGEDVEPDGRPPAPGPLRLIQQFVNTYNHEFELARDRLRTPVLARTWLVRHGVLHPREAPMSRTDHRSLLALREALRAVLVDGMSQDASAAALDLAARRARFTIQFPSESGPRLTPTATGVAGAAGEILSAAFEAGVEGTWARLKACRQCEWIFFDRSKNRSSEWCSMSICGNRMKNREYRRRHSGNMGRT